MSAMAVGQRLVELCKERRVLDAINELYAEDVVSVEAAAPPDGQREAKGIDAVRGGGRWWMIDNHEVHSASVRGPDPHAGRFCVVFDFDVTNKPSGQRMQMEEVARYTVSDGKITREEFFHSM